MHARAYHSRRKLCTLNKPLDKSNCDYASPCARLIDVQETIDFSLCEQAHLCSIEKIQENARNRDCDTIYQDLLWFIQQYSCEVPTDKCLAQTDNRFASIAPVLSFMKKVALSSHDVYIVLKLYYKPTWHLLLTLL